MALPDNAKDMVVEYIKSKSKSKSKFYMKDFYSVFPDEGSRTVTKFINKMVEEGILEYWSSGSSTMIGIKGAGKQADAEGEH